MFKKSLKEMFINFNVDNKEQFELFYRKLKESGVNEDLIENNIKMLMYAFKPEFGRKIPCIAEIIGISIESKETADIEMAWDKFKKTCCNNHKFETMEDWVFTIKTAIGVGEVEEMNWESEKWIKKEFLRIYPAIKSGIMELKKEPCKYEKIGSSSIKIDDKSVKLIEENKMHRISETGISLDKENYNEE